MKNESATDRDSELERRTNAAGSGSGGGREIPLSPGNLSDMWHVESGQQADPMGGSISPADPSMDEWDEADIDPDDVEDEMGLLFCCGERLVWRDEWGDGILEAYCHECGSDYACDPGPTRFKAEEEDPDAERWRDAF